MTAAFLPQKLTPPAGFLTPYDFDIILPVRHLSCTDLVLHTTLKLYLLKLRFYNILSLEK